VAAVFFFFKGISYVRDRIIWKRGRFLLLGQSTLLDCYFSMAGPSYMLGEADFCRRRPYLPVDQDSSCGGYMSLIMDRFKLIEGAI
jgi:hypothetical protein